MKRLRIPVALAALALAELALAASQARLTGKVTDAAGNPLEGVSVTLTTPNITTFKVVLKTDKKGQFGTIVNDATMPYALKFEKEGYVTSEAKKKIPVGDTGVVDMKLLKPSETSGGQAAAAAPSKSDEAKLAYNAGVEALNGGDKAGAEAKFLEATQKDPDLPQAWQALTSLSFQKKDWAKTLEYGQKAVDLDPEMTAVYGMLAVAAGNAGDKKAAAEWQAKYAEANPDTPDALYNKGIDAYNKKKLQDAESFLTKAVEAKPDFALAHFWLGMTSFQLSKKPAAREHLQKYLEIEPEGAEAATAKEILPLTK